MVHFILYLFLIFYIIYYICFSEPAPMVAKEGVWVWSDLDVLQTRTGNALYNGEEEDRDMWLWLLRKLFVPRKYF